MAAPGEEKRKLEIFVPIGADDGDKLIIEEEGQPSEFTGEQCNHPRTLLTLNNSVALCPSLTYHPVHMIDYSVRLD